MEKIIAHLCHRAVDDLKAVYDQEKKVANDVISLIKFMRDSRYELQDEGVWIAYTTNRNRHIQESIVVSVSYKEDGDKKRLVFQTDNGDEVEMGDIESEEMGLYESILSDIMNNYLANTPNK